MTTTTEDIRKKVLDAATELLGDHGLRKLTQPQVAKRAGVRQSHVTYYFPRRSDLIAAVARSYSDSVAGEVLQKMQTAQAGTLAESLSAFTTTLIGDRRRTRTLIGLLVASEEDAELRAQMLEGVLALRAVMEQVIGVPPGDPAAAVLQATIWGLSVQHLLMGKQQTQAQLAALVAHTARLAQVKLEKPKAQVARRRSA
jgi:AcrR family transcriptional regulator